LAPKDHVWLFWEWGEDSHLAADLIKHAAARNLRARAFFYEDLPSPGELRLQAPLLLWDRAGDVYESARRLADWAEALGSRVINPARGMLLAKDKAVLHKLLELRGLPVPHTRFFTDASSLEEMQLSLGKYLVLKPVRSGGGEGVRIQEWCEKCLREAMRTRSGETWLLQEHVDPCIMAGRRAWFRVFYLFGEIRICWWDNHTHIYEWMPLEEVECQGFAELLSLGRRIGEAFPLQFFSTEIALCADGRLVVVDYVNDPCDLRSISRIPNGVPTELLDWVFGKILDKAAGLEREPRVT